MPAMAAQLQGLDSWIRQTWFNWVLGLVGEAEAYHLPWPVLCTQVTAGLKEVRDRISSVKNTQKITEAMKLVAAAKASVQRVLPCSRPGPAASSWTSFH